MALVKLPCPAGGGCSYKTPELEAADALKLLEMHERTAHNGANSQSSDGGVKPEKFPRPTQRAPKFQMRPQVGGE